MADANVVRQKLGRIGSGSSTPKAVPARAKGRCEMVPDPTPPYRVPDFCPDCRENTLRRAGISSERQAAYQRRLSSLLAGRG